MAHSMGDKKELIRETGEMLARLRLALGGEERFQQVVEVCLRAELALKRDETQPSWIELDDEAVITASKFNLSEILGSLRRFNSSPFKSWDDCHTVSDVVSYALYVVEKVVRAALDFLSAGWISPHRSREHYFFQGPQEPQKLQAAISDLHVLLEKIENYLNPTSSSQQDLPNY
ncbi:MAG: hypothetical protein P1U61_00310 [Legionellaceae bacterium]|nr:hypothetical protein [Legionellaceae bacterium]